MELRKKSIHELRVMAQAFGVDDIFEKEANLLAQEIELKQREMIQTVTTPPPLPAYDARLMTKPPARISDPLELVKMLEPYIKLGLKAKVDAERWYFILGNKTDEGTMRMPPRQILLCAEKLLK